MVMINVMSHALCLALAICSVVMGQYNDGYYGSHGTENVAGELEDGTGYGTAEGPVAQTWNEPAAGEEAQTWDGTAAGEVAQTWDGTAAGEVAQTWDGTAAGTVAQPLDGTYGQVPENRGSGNIESNNGDGFGYEEARVSKSKVEKLLQKLQNLIKDFFTKEARADKNKLMKKLSQRFLTQIETMEQEICKVFDEEGDKEKAEDCEDFMDKIDNAECGANLAKCAGIAFVSKAQAAKCVVQNAPGCMTSII